MKRKKTPETIHTWLIMMKASQAVHHLAFPPILREGLGDSDFRVLDVLLHKGPMPVNAIGPKVDLNPGSVSVAVERLYKKGLVSRVESESDRRVRTVRLRRRDAEYSFQSSANTPLSSNVHFRMSRLRSSARWKKCSRESEDAPKN